MYVMKKIMNDIIETIDKNSTTILAGAAVAGVIGTVTLGIRATAKVCDELDKKTRSQMTKKEIIKKVWKYYISTTICGVSTVVCIISLHRINNKKLMTLVSTCKALESAGIEYQKKVEETIGSEQEKKIKEAIIKDKIDRDDINKKEVIVLDGNQMVYDTLSGRYFMSDEETILKVVNRCNSMILFGDGVTLNDFYAELELPPIDIGDKLSWDCDSGLIEITLGGTRTRDGRLCLTIQHENQPRFEPFEM